MKDRKGAQRRAVEKLWALMVSNPPPDEDVSICEEYFTWVVGRLAEDPDFQALASATSWEMAKGQARKREFQDQDDDWPFGGIS